MRLRNNLEKVDSDTLNKIWQINYFSLRNIIKTLVLRDLISKDISLVYISSIVSSLGFKEYHWDLSFRVFPHQPFSFHSDEKKYHPPRF